jgi:hypothetical protein
LRWKSRDLMMMMTLVAGWVLIRLEVLAAQLVRLAVVCLIYRRLLFEYVPDAAHRVDIVALGLESSGSEARQDHRDGALHSGVLVDSDEQYDQ